jgi:hypothetical protein
MFLELLVVEVQALGQQINLLVYYRHKKTLDLEQLVVRALQVLATVVPVS